MGERRYPLADLVALMRLPAEQLDRSSEANPFRSHRPSDNEARRILDIGGSRWRTLHRDGLTPDQAERYAARVGFHPCDVWPTWYDDEFDELALTCAADRCEVRFIPTRRGHVCCSPECSKRRHARTDSYRESQRRYAAKSRARKALAAA